MKYEMVLGYDGVKIEILKRTYGITRGRMLGLYNGRIFSNGTEKCYKVNNIDNLIK